MRLSSCPLICLAAVSLAPPLSASSQVPRFEVLSVKACNSGAGDGGRGGSGSAASPGRLDLRCMTVAALVRMAYITYAGGHFNLLLNQPLEGLPSWTESASYQIDARAEGVPGPAMMRGPMLQTILEDRFHLRMLHKSKEGPVYALTVAKGGVKLEPAKPGDCVPPDYGLPTPYPQFCGAPKRGDRGLHLIGASMTDLCRILSAPEISDMPVIDHTGLTGMFDIPLPGPGMIRGADAQPDDSPFPAIRAALAKFGLNLERSKGAIDILVVDHIERPAEN